MDNSMLVFALLIILLALLVIFIVVRNQRDKKELKKPEISNLDLSENWEELKLTEQLNENYKKPKSTHSDIEIEDRQSV